MSLSGNSKSACLAAETHSQSQKSTCKDLTPKWPKPSHLGARPLTLRFLSAPVHALVSNRASSCSAIIENKRSLRK
ncbi:hypothetical protein BVJ53_12130 [Lacticaseibacillus chiayiensis]|uniref:Uncharacterized protein n=1 Tax=Lacticaseibacillus chiayiensis TaxID=2100821 RepID=A0A4Q1TKI0_9LACO|nr:hypothetical protein BVJ53_12130 [Lacticaseibacillus chiayiensis]